MKKIKILYWLIFSILLIVFIVYIGFQSKITKNSSTILDSNESICKESYNIELQTFFMDMKSLPNNWVLNYSKDEKTYEHLSQKEDGRLIWKKFYNVYFGLYQNSEDNLSENPKKIGQRIFRFDSYEIAKQFYLDENLDMKENTFNFESDFADEYGYYCSKKDDEKCYWIARYGCIVSKISTRVSQDYISKEIFQNFIYYSDSRFNEILSAK